MSLNSSQPVRMYQFDRSASVIWRYTSADRAISHAGHNWLPQPISDDGIRMTGEASADAMEITLPAALPVVLLFRVTPPSEELFVTVFDYDAVTGDADVAWVGSISAAKFEGSGAAKLVCHSLSASMARDGLRLGYERSCPHSVYDGACGVNKALYALPVVVTGLTGTSLSYNASAVPDQSIYSYGAAAWTVDGAVEMRGIEVAADSWVQLVGGTYGLAVGDSITLYPGCDGLRSTCNNRFGNLLNHGGFPHMPGESIYGKRLW